MSLASFTDISFFWDMRISDLPGWEEDIAEVVRATEEQANGKK